MKKTKQVLRRSAFYRPNIIGLNYPGSVGLVHSTMLRAIRNIDYVILLCEDIPRMKRFYNQVMGFPIDEDVANWVKMRVGSGFLTLRPRGRSYDGPGSSGSAAVQLAFRVAPAEVDSCYEELVQNQVEILEAPTVKDYGHKTLFFRDPEGNILEIYADV